MAMLDELRRNHVPGLALSDECNPEVNEIHLNIDFSNRWPC
jgi:hypothetical protein